MKDLLSPFKRAKAAATSAAARHATNVADRAAKTIRQLDESHEEIADHADTVAKATRVAAAVAVTGAAVAAPTGLTAVGVALGVVSAPILTTAAPVLLLIAGGALTISAAASLYSKSRRRKSLMTPQTPMSPSDVEVNRDS
ncbi:MAG: hypothetical protein Q8M80_12925 [Hydrogenophaga sp.]|nr:hypothetical protein [Hydrogenophaga sp.]